MAPPKADLPQGTLDLLVLKIVALGPLHGYGIAQRLQQMSRDVVQVTQGTLYPALHRLENRGLLDADWKASDTGREARGGTAAPSFKNAVLENGLRVQVPPFIAAGEKIIVATEDGSYVRRAE